MTVRHAAATTAEALATSAARAGSSEALSCDGSRVTFDELQSRALAIAGGLRARGVADGDRIAIWLPNGIDWAAASFATGRIGTVVPVNTRYRAEELAVVLAHSRAAALVVAGGADGERQRESLDSVRARVPGVRVVATAAELAASDAGGGRKVASGHPALIQYTSGTTARPKGVVLGHEQVLRNGWELAARLDVRPGDRYASAMPFYHVGGSVLTLLLAVVCEATAVTLGRFDAALMIDALERERCTHFFGVESMCVMMLERPELDRIDRRALRVAFVGGRRVVLEAVRERLCPVIVNRYGLTESSGNTCCTEVGDTAEVALTTMGRPLPGLEVRIVDGEIRVRGWGVTSGYLDDPAATAAAFDEDGWFRTGDVGEVTPEGRLRFLGRARDSLRVGGENVLAAEIEELIARHEGVVQVAVVPLEDERLGEVPVAFVELAAGASASEEAIIAFCRAKAAGYKVPRRIHFVRPSDWPMTGSGKIQKHALRERARVGAPR